jgi:hypothetical protein
MSISWATNSLHFHQNKVFKSKFCILALFGLVTVFTTFQNIGRFFSKSSGHPAWAGPLKLIGEGYNSI